MLLACPQFPPLFFSKFKLHFSFYLLYMPKTASIKEIAQLYKDSRAALDASSPNFDAIKPQLSQLKVRSFIWIDMNVTTTVYLIRYILTYRLRWCRVQWTSPS